MASNHSGTRTPSEIIRSAQNMLKMARQGLADLQGEDAVRRMAGVVNMITCGRRVSFILQNLTTPLGSQWDVWYKSKQDEMRLDASLDYFREARNHIEKRGFVPVSQVSQIHSFTDSDFRKLGPRPENAKSFFFGDELGGSGWIIEDETGQELKVYVTVSSEIFSSTFVFADLGPGEPDVLVGKGVAAEGAVYLDKLETLVNEAKETFQI